MSAWKRREEFGDATLYLGDCLEIMPELGRVDAVIADTPYGTTACKWDSVIPLNLMWERIGSVSRPGAAVVLTASQPYSSALVMSNPEMFRHEWIWIKNRGSNFANTVREPMKEHEAVLVFSNGGWTFHKQMQERSGSGRDRVNYGINNKTSSENYRAFDRAEIEYRGALRVPSSWQKFNTCTSRFHPTVKPVPLMEYLVRTYTSEGELVLDFTMGSGTTGVACMNLGRRFIGIEIEEKYFDIACRRIDLASRQERMPLEAL